MLTPRNLVLLAIVVTLASIAWAGVSLMKPPDSGGMGSDSFGTQGRGQRALFETLTELGVPVERSLGPPTAVLDRHVTLVIWRPHAGLVRAEPAYLHALARWVEQGGRVVVAPGPPDESSLRDPPPESHNDEPEKSVLDQLGLKQVGIQTLDWNSRAEAEGPAGGETADVAEPTSPPAARTHDVGFKKMIDIITGAVSVSPTRLVSVTARGTLARPEAPISSIDVPEENLQTLDLGKNRPDGAVTFPDPRGREQTLVAAFRRGRGELVVVASPEIAENRAIAHADNSVLAVALVAAPGRPVVFDEFYHGLTIRGNAMWLFTQQGYAATALCLLAALALWIWREAVFLGPPLDEPAPVRRTIGEYVAAMARFLSRGKSSPAFLLGELRSGVLRSVREELRLPPGREDVAQLAAAVARRDPPRARRLLAAVAAVDEALSQPRRLRKSAALELFKRITTCL